jgi:hypothetical protein
MVYAAGLVVVHRIIGQITKAALVRLVAGYAVTADRLRLFHCLFVLFFYIRLLF